MPRNSDIISFRSINPSCISANTVINILWKSVTCSSISRWCTHIPIDSNVRIVEQHFLRSRNCKYMYTLEDVFLWRMIINNKHNIWLLSALNSLRPHDGKNDQFEGILPKGPYSPCLRMADRALLAGYPRIMACSSTSCVLMLATKLAELANWPWVTGFAVTSQRAPHSVWWQRQMTVELHTLISYYKNIKIYILWCIAMRVKQKYGHKTWTSSDMNLRCNSWFYGKYRSVFCWS